VPVGNSGEALLRGPVVVKGYYRNPEMTRHSWTADGWYKTGDIICCDIKTGLFHMGDRKKELVRTKAGPISPTDLQALLLSHPLVADVAVVGVPADLVKSGSSLNTNPSTIQRHSGTHVGYGKILDPNSTIQEVPRAYVVLDSGGANAEAPEYDDDEESPRHKNTVWDNRGWDLAGQHGNADEVDRDTLAGDIIAYVEEVLPEAQHMWLAGGVGFIDAVPRNAAGKMLRWKLLDPSMVKYMNE